ncbi:MAG TPA: MoxR family ATPase [Pyrinomonadaceae bacterium]|nr:MoxR family ATPase [Pyrinomonadaceae bacterium]
MINTVSCTPDEAKELIKLLRRLKISFMLWGATGVGKSEAVRQLAEELNAELRDIRLCQKQPTDIGGLPALDHETRQTVFYPPAFLAPQAEGKPVVLFFDEISLAPDDTKGAVLGILEERRQGSIEIPDNWIVVAAGNRPEDLANARGLGAAANRRLLHVVIEPQLEATLHHFMKIGVVAEILAFLKVFPQHLSGEESARTQKHELYPRPSSWEKVSKIFETLRRDNKRVRHLAIAGIIGDSVAAEFMLLAEEVKNMKSVDELLEIQRKTPSKIGAYLPDSVNGLYALSFAIATRASEETAVELLELVNRFDEQTGERFAHLAMRDLQTMAGSLLLEKIWKAGWKVENERAFWRYNEKREAAALCKQSDDAKSLTTASTTTITAATAVA